jgi:hypothetical protein
MLINIIKSSIIINKEMAVERCWGLICEHCVACHITRPDLVYSLIRISYEC